MGIRILDFQNPDFNKFVFIMAIQAPGTRTRLQFICGISIQFLNGKIASYHSKIRLRCPVCRCHFKSILLTDWFPRKNSRQHNNIYNVYLQRINNIEFYFTMDDRITIPFNNQTKFDQMVWHSNPLCTP